MLYRLAESLPWNRFIWAPIFTNLGSGETQREYTPLQEKETKAKARKNLRLSEGEAEWRMVHCKFKPGQYSVSNIKIHIGHK
jgi:hypothetical protein